MSWVDVSLSKNGCFAKQSGLYNLKGVMTKHYLTNEDCTSTAQAMY